MTTTLNIYEQLWEPRAEDRCAMVHAANYLALALASEILGVMWYHGKLDSSKTGWFPYHVLGMTLAL